MKYEPTRAVPLVATDKGFLAKMHIEINFVEDNDSPEQLPVILHLPGNEPVNVSLKRIKKGVFRSAILLEILIPYEKIK